MTLMHRYICYIVPLLVLVGVLGTQLSYATHTDQYMFGYSWGKYAAANPDAAAGLTSLSYHISNATKLDQCTGNGPQGSFDGDGNYVNLTGTDNQKRCLTGLDAGFASVKR